MMLMFFCLFVLGCNSSRYGNHLKEPIEHGSIINNLIDQIKDIYPPANTELHLIHKILKDEFGTSLIDELRAAGYLISMAESGVTKSKNALDFAYLIDKPKNTVNLLRLTLSIGNETMTCGYDTDTLTPIGVWTKGGI